MARKKKTQPKKRKTTPKVRPWPKTKKINGKRHNLLGIRKTRAQAKSHKKGWNKEGFSAPVVTSKQDRPDPSPSKIKGTEFIKKGRYAVYTRRVLRLPRKKK